MSLRDILPEKTLPETLWERALFGISADDWLTAAGIVLVALLLRGIAAHVFLAVARTLLAKSRIVIEREDELLLLKIFRFAFLSLGLVLAVRTLPLTGGWLTIARSLSRSLAAASFFALVYALIPPFVRRMNEWSAYVTPIMAAWLTRILLVTITFIGAAAVLDYWGIKVGPLLAGLGLFGVAVALGAQDIFKNLLSGLFIVGEHRFEPGDLVLVEGLTEGVVETIGFRTTTIRTAEKAPVYIPNAELANKPLTNLSRRTHRRIHWLIALEYRTSAEQLRRIRDGIEAHILENNDFADENDAAATVRIEEFSDSAIRLSLTCFTRTTDTAEFSRIREALALKIKEIVEAAGAGFAFPSQSLYIEATPTRTIGEMPA